MAVESAEEMATNTIDALDMDSLSERLKDIDVTEVMSRVYMAVDDRQERTARNVTAAISARENAFWNNKQEDQKTHISDEDIEKLARKFASAASKEMANELDGLKMYYKERELSRVIREVSK